MQKSNLNKSPLFFNPEDLIALKNQFQTSLFTADRHWLKRDLEILEKQELPPTTFSWWCVNLPDAMLAGQFQAAQESLLTAWHLLEYKNAPQLARNLLISQANLPTWLDKEYGLEIGHDLSSSHHCRGLSAGLETAKGILTVEEIQKIYTSYTQKVRLPYLNASFEGNDYLTGYRNTNWLSHLSGSVLISEIAWAKYGLEDRATIALAKANVLRYVDCIRPDGSLPEIGDYFHYGMEFALLSLHAWSLHYKKNLIEKYAQSGLSKAIHFCMAFTDKNGEFWADFGDTHIGKHEASRVVGYLYAYRLQSECGQWLGDLPATREPIAALLRPINVNAKFTPPSSANFAGEEMIVFNENKHSLAFRGGACRSKKFNIPHRHYDSGSLIYRINNINVLSDSGHDMYTDTFWKNYDDPKHEKSAPHFHNIILINDRGHQKEDETNGKIIVWNDRQAEYKYFIWQLTSSFPNLKLWERQVLLLENTNLIVIDRLIADGAKNIKVLWHYHDLPTIHSMNVLSTNILAGKFYANCQFKVSIDKTHPKPCSVIDINIKETDQNPKIIVSSFADKNDKPLSINFDQNESLIKINNKQWNIKDYYFK